MGLETITRNDTGAAVEDIQHRLAALGYLNESEITSVFDDVTAEAVKDFCRDYALEEREEVDDDVWSRLVDASFEFGDRSLYLRVPFFHGNDVKTLQEALSALGFSCGGVDGYFGPHTEDALRKFQFNMGLPHDGIAGAFTYRVINNLQHSWKGKDISSSIPRLGFARAAKVLETNYLCLFGTTDFTRSVAARMSNLALATSPNSTVTSADSLLVAPDDSTMFIQILAGDEKPSREVLVVDFLPEDSLPLRLSQAILAVKSKPARLALRLPAEGWEDAGETRSAQHYAIVLLDALCSALALRDEAL